MSLLLRIAGGAQKVLKHVVKAKITTRVMQADAGKWAALRQICMQIHDNDNFSVRDAITSMPLDQHDRLNTFLQERVGKTTNKVKLETLYQFLPLWIEINSCIEKLSLAMSRLKELTQANIDEVWMSDETGAIDFDAVKLFVSNSLARKQALVEVGAADAAMR
jgi:hypothetical protein